MVEGKKWFSICLLVLCMSVLGCGKTGEKEAEKMVKESCNIPDSFKKVTYEVDDKNKISFLDFKAKNMLGVEIPARVYFSLSDNKVTIIDTEGVDKKIIDEFYKETPAQFAQAIKSYRKLSTLYSKTSYDRMVAKMFHDEVNRLKYQKNNYFVWKSIKDDAPHYNAYVKKCRDAYNEAPEIVKKKIKHVPKYAWVTLNGSYMDGWESQIKWKDEAPSSNL